MKWLKKGLIYKPDNTIAWMNTHAQVPTALLLEDRIRIYIASRPEPTISLTTFIDVDIKDPTKIIHINKEPILPLGKPGTFDEFGVMPSAVLRHNNQVWLYTLGWQRGATVPYLNNIGLAVSNDNGATFNRMFEGPIMSTTPHEPYSAMALSIIKEDNQWQMWYGSGTNWIEVEGKYEPLYTIHYAHSTDGIHWERPNICCIPGKTAEEANSRASVIKHNGAYHMWFSYRDGRDFRGGKGSYRIGYATSNNGTNWQRNDEDAGITVSSDTYDWDSQMIEYPNIINTPYGRYMFYNGNGFGESGFGYAVLDEQQ